VYRLTLNITSKEAQIVESLWSKDSVHDANADVNYQAQLVDFLLSNLLLGEQKPFPLPQDLKEPAPGVFQHSFSGTGYKEIPAHARKPWSRIHPADCVDAFSFRKTAVLRERVSGLGRLFRLVGAFASARV
jgi:hypothetical protein